MKKETQYRSYISNSNFKPTAGLKDLFHIRDPKISYNGNVTVCKIEVEDWLLSDFPSYNTFNVVGISRCHEEDKFDKVIGRDIAEHKALAKAYRIMGQRLKEMSKNHMSLGKGYEELYKIVEEKSTKQMNFSQDHI